MSVMITRWLFPINCATLMMISACDVQTNLAQETDAELFCRQGGFDLGSTAYEDCVEASSELALRPAGDRESDTANLDHEQAERSAADSKTVTAARAGVSEPPESSKQATAVESELSERPLLAVHLSSVRTQAATEIEWKRLQKLFPELLGDRDMIVQSVELEGKGTYFRVLTGPFADYGKAEGFCAILKTQQQYCLAMRLRKDRAEIPSKSG